jgi:hypothetical protein
MRAVWQSGVRVTREKCENLHFYLDRIASICFTQHMRLASLNFAWGSGERFQTGFEKEHGHKADLDTAIDRREYRDCKSVVRAAGVNPALSTTLPHPASHEARAANRFGVRQFNFRPAPNGSIPCRVSVDTCAASTARGHGWQNAPKGKAIRRAAPEFTFHSATSLRG